MKKILEKDDYHCIDQGIELWNNNNEFFIIQEYDVEELESSGDKTQNFFTCEKTNQLISEFEKIQDNKIKKNTSLFVSVKVNNIKEVYERFKNIAMRIEEDEYYFRKYIIFYTDKGLNDSYFIAMQLIIKLPFISLPHSDKPFATIEDKIKLRMESEQQVKKEQQVNQILEWFDSDNIREQLENSDIFDNLRQILEE
ncbi:ABC-three component system middle component 1 [Streptococcus sanguinis]|uniref:ABC-three component system middle component 1 n=1 Tax=Streptococcus sanguinis TaxID=1305 RepID=UPI0021ADF431|nr:ABC-three component system middle component 1 [Streptococcus sanguinis]